MRIATWEVSLTSLSSHFELADVVLVNVSFTFVCHVSEIEVALGLGVSQLLFHFR